MSDTEDDEPEDDEPEDWLEAQFEKLKGTYIDVVENDMKEDLWVYCQHYSGAPPDDFGYQRERVPPGGRWTYTWKQRLYHQVCVEYAGPPPKDRFEFECEGVIRLAGTPDGDTIRFTTSYILRPKFPHHPGFIKGQPGNLYEEDDDGNLYEVQTPAQMQIQAQIQTQAQLDTAGLVTPTKAPQVGEMQVEPTETPDLLYFSMGRETTARHLASCCMSSLFSLSFCMLLLKCMRSGRRWRSGRCLLLRQRECHEPLMNA
eukprot:gnl/MRDRNA2_/MRDRNA2_149869_c0_seq1.p1 gnl/MRDRNA2_/MRDRNA2_149869_c0~~gnl/MRDRNA2_/MRDRNA2_149869_c0_seq1.p1  ORF type:complete len:258 (-),score=20.44 gnl/MRDRNA2_/MRDRNA2_149869_c0_seq1:8-781(-)